MYSVHAYLRVTGALRVILVDIIIHSSIKIARFYCLNDALNRVLRAMLVPSRTLYACKRKFLQCEATRSVESSITGVATNNYSMNFNYFATRGGGTGQSIPPPWIRH